MRERGREREEREFGQKWDLQRQSEREQEKEKKITRKSPAENYTLLPPTNAVVHIFRRSSKICPICRQSNCYVVSFFQYVYAYSNYETIINMYHLIPYVCFCRRAAQCCKIANIHTQLAGFLFIFPLTRHHRRRVGQILDARRPRPVAQEGDPPRVPAELPGVLLDPLEHGHLVHQAVVGDLASGQRGGVGVQEA